MHFVRGRRGWLRIGRERVDGSRLWLTAGDWGVGGSVVGSEL